MFFKVSDTQFFAYYHRLSQAYEQCTTLEDYVKLDISFSMLWKQRDTLKRIYAIQTMLEQRQRLLKTLKDNHVIKHHKISNPR